MARELFRAGQVDKAEHRVHYMSWHGSIIEIFGHGFYEDTKDSVRPAAVVIQLSLRIVSVVLSAIKNVEHICHGVN